jgi:hypothetical protein
MKYVSFILKVLELKALNLCHQYRARPTCTSMQSDQRCILLAENFKYIFKLISLKLIMDSPKNGSGTSPFTIFSMFRVNFKGTLSLRNENIFSY